MQARHSSMGPATDAASWVKFTLLSAIGCLEA